MSRLRPTIRPARAPRPIAGFSLTEVLIALGLFALGFVAVASLVPSGALLQQQTTDDVRLEQTKANAEAVTRAVGRKIDSSDVSFYSTGEWQYMIDPGDLGTNNNGWLRHDTNPVFSTFDRTYPTSAPHFPEDAETLRRYEWIPLIRNRRGAVSSSDAEWSIISLVVRLPREGGTWVTTLTTDPFIQPSPPPPANSLVRQASIPSNTPAGRARIRLDNQSDFDEIRDDRLLRENDRIVDSFGNVYRLRGFEEPDWLLLDQPVRYELNPATRAYEAPERIFYVVNPTPDRASPLRGVTKPVEVTIE